MFFDPRKRWTLMGGSQGAPLSPRFGQGALSQWFESQKGIGPNYGNPNDQLDTTTAATNNAAINAAMARQASQTPTAPFGGGIGKSAYQGAGLSTKKKGLSMKNMIKALTEMKKPADLKAPGAKLMGEARPQLPGPPPFAPLGGVNQSIMNVGGLGDEANERWRKIMGYS